MKCSCSNSFKRKTTAGILITRQVSEDKQIAASVNTWCYMKSTKNTFINNKNAVSVICIGAVSMSNSGSEDYFSTEKTSNKRYM